jgi:hypothetical protein
VKRNDWVSDCNMPSRKTAGRTIACASPLGLFVFLLCLSSGTMTPRSSGGQKPNGAEKQGKPLRVVSIRFGQFGGTIESFWPLLEVRKGQATLTQSWSGEPQNKPRNVRDVKVRADLSGKHWQEIQALVNRDQLLALPDRTSCASCADGIDEFVEMEFSDHVKKSVTYAQGRAPAQLKELAAKLKALQKQLQNELPPGQN